MKNLKLRIFLFFIFFLASCILHLATDALADTIKILIVDEETPRIPAKGEHLEKIGQKLIGDFLTGGAHYTGEIEVWKGKNGLYVVNELPFEDYIKNVVMAEVGNSWDMEALKAQAVIARTYAVYQKNSNGNAYYHLTSSVLHQAYKGNSSNPRIANAVEKTQGEILTYEGKPIQALYHSTCGGKTELPEEVFGKSFPYLQSVESSCENSPYWVWERKIPLSELEKALNLQGVKEVRIKSYTSTDRAKELMIDTTAEQEFSVKAAELRKMLGWQRLPSTNFSVYRDGDSLIFEGRGYGHGVGLCQWSALELARKGKNYKEILAFFYPGTEIRLHEGR